MVRALSSRSTTNPATQKNKQEFGLSPELLFFCFLGDCMGLGIARGTVPYRVLRKLKKHAVFEKIVHTVISVISRFCSSVLSS